MSRILRRRPFIAALALCLLVPSAAAAAEPSYTPAPGSPLSPSGNGGSGVAFSPSGALLAEGTEMFSVGGSGALTPVGGAAPDSSARAVAFSPSGALLAAANTSAKSVSMFSVGSSGALTSVSGSPFTLGAQPSSVVFSPGGKLLEVTAGEAVYVFSVSISGALTPAAGSPHSVKGAGRVAFNAAGGLLAVPGTAGVSMFSVSSSGVLTSVLGSPFAASGEPAGTVAFASGGTALTVSNLSCAGCGVSIGITAYSVAASGVLTPTGASSTPSASQAFAFNPAGSTAVTTPYNAAGLNLQSISSSGALGALQSLKTPERVQSIAFSAGGDIAAEGISRSLVVFVPSSSSAGTSWVGTIGSSGYDLAGWNGENDASNLPGASVSLVKGSRVVWAQNTSDLRALPNPGALTRTASGYSDPSQVQVKVTFQAAYTGNLRLYAVDWAGGGAKEAESITVGSSSPVGFSDNVDMGSRGFSEGQWAIFPVTEKAGESLTITVTNQAGAAAVLSGIFLGDAGTPPGPVVAGAAQATWVGAVGSAGYDLAGWNGAAGDVSYLPNAALTLQQGSRYEWASNTTDPRALSDPGEHTRNAGTYYDSSQVTVTLNFTAAYSGNLRLYAVDWDGAGRRETITVNDGSGPRMVLLNADFSQGAWASFPISVAAGGTVTITVQNNSSPATTNAVLSGVFLGDAGPPPAPKVESAPQGKWVNAVGSAGYDLAGWNGTAGDVSYLPNAALTLQQGSRYEWAANTTDPRALGDPGEHTRDAGTYYDANQIQMQLSFQEAYTGNLHLYAVDWDAAGRREAISVNGQTAVLGNDFSQGAWVSFPVSVPAGGGTVSITVTRLVGGNAVLSGIFLGDAGPAPAPKMESAPQGTWVGAVGSAGYDLAGWNGASDLASLPGASLTVEQASRYTWAPTTAEARALQSVDKSTRMAATYYDANQIRLSLKFSSAYSGNLHLYAVDWDTSARREAISVNGETAALTSSFNQGAWVSFPVSVAAGGTVSIVVTRTAGANAVLSGIFLGDAGAPAAPAAQKALIPLYDNANAADWTEACSQTGAGSLLIADVAEGQGPGSASVPAWANVIDNCSSYGRAAVIGYVWTDYGAGGQASIAGIESQINAWYSYYPGAIAGIFFDGVSDAVPGTSTSNQSFYRTLASYVRSHEGAGAEVVFNFGANPGSDWMLNSSEASNNANVVVTFEGSYNTAGEGPYTSWTQAPWEAAYPANDFAALIYNAPESSTSPQPASSCSSLAKQNIGYAYVGTWYDVLAPYFASFLTDSSKGEC
jgi:Spherulation-specific family 4